MEKYIFCLGGSMSSLGKGILTSSIGNLLEACGKRVALMKIDPYINLSSSLLSPREHGETYVLPDGWECDLDLGNYYRYTNSPLTKDHSITTGRIWKQVLENSEKGVYLGKTVQIIPHVTNEICRRVELVAEKTNADYTLIEVGGTVGDFESDQFIEAIRQMKMKLNEDEKHVEIVFLTYVPTTANGEIKTKLTQSAVKALQERGVQPDILVCRAEKPLDDSLKEKIALFTNVKKNSIYTSPNLQYSVYRLPEVLEKEGLVISILKDFKDIETTLDENGALKVSKEWKETWGSLTDKFQKLESEPNTIKVGIIGKYFENPDSYKSIDEALLHAGFSKNRKVEIHYINVDLFDTEEKIESNNFEAAFGDIDGWLIPGGFGDSRIESMLNIIKKVREMGKPIFGICLGMQLLTIDYARNFLKMKDANSTEFNPKTKHPVVSRLTEQMEIQTMDGTLRLGSVKSKVDRDSIFYEAYKTTEIEEIHRHRWEVNLEAFKNRHLESIKLGSIMSVHKVDNAKLGRGIGKVDTNLCESIEYVSKPIFGVQYHPELKSKLFNPHPLFVKFIENCIQQIEDRNTKAGE